MDSANSSRSYRAALYFHFISVALVIFIVFLYAIWFVLVQQVQAVYLASLSTQDLQAIVSPAILEDSQFLIDYFNKTRTRLDRPEITSSEAEQIKKDVEKKVISNIPTAQFTLFLSLIFHLPIYYFWGKQIISETRSFGNSVARGTIYSYPRKNDSSILKMVSELCKEMEIDPRKLEIMTTMGRNAPFVIKWKKAYYLVIPIIALNSAEEIRSLIAHELAHILQRDASMGRWCRIVSTATHRFLFLDFLVACLCITLANMAYTEVNSTLAQSMGMILYFLFFFSYLFIKIAILAAVSLIPFFLARLLFVWILNRSEYLADKASVIFCGNDGLSSALIKFALDDEDKKYSSTHPSLSKRLAKINKMQNSHSVSLNLGR